MTILLLLLGVRVAAAFCDRVDATARVFRDTGSEKAVLRSHAKIRLVAVKVIGTGDGRFGRVVNVMVVNECNGGMVVVWTGAAAIT